MNPVDATTTTDDRHALVLGGNGFIGSHVVRALIRDGHAVTAVNRGRREWLGDPEAVHPPVDVYNFDTAGDDIKAFRGDAGYPRSKNEVAHIVCDRKQTRAFADAVDVATGTTLGANGAWDVVVDLSGFTPRDLRAALRGLKGRTRRYVFVSSDSVYEVCDECAREDASLGSACTGERKKETNDGEGDGGNGSNGLNTLNGGGVREEHARRPVDAAAAEALAREDRYGHHKLRCEEILAKIASTRGMDGRATSNGEEAPDLSSSSSDDAATWSDESDDESDDSDSENDSDDDVNDDDLVPVPWLAIRLPDVIGPRDGTYRLWRYQMWVQCVDVLGPVVVSPDLATGGSRALSFAYAPDVAGLVAKVARGECDARLGRSYNVACVERVSLQEIVEHVAECVREIGDEESAPGDEKSAPGEAPGGVRSVVEVHEPGRGRKRGWDDSAEATEVGSSVRTSSRQRTSPEFYPSVDGGAIDPSRAIGELGFAPTPLRDAVRETVRWCAGMCAGNGDVGRRERAEAARRLRRSFGLKLFSDDAKALRVRLRRLGFPEPKDRWGDDAE